MLVSAKRHVAKLRHSKPAARGRRYPNCLLVENLPRKVDVSKALPQPVLSALVLRYEARAEAKKLLVATVASHTLPHFGQVFFTVLRIP